MRLIGRWLRFNVVGAAGILVQLAAVLVLSEGLRIHPLPATALAVELAVLHNFFWHEHWTWKDRRNAHKAMVVLRMLRFHLSNGLLPISGNVILVRWMVDSVHLGVITANLVSIALCSLSNFILAEFAVFRRHSSDS